MAFQNTFSSSSSSAFSSISSRSSTSSSRSSIRPCSTLPSSTRSSQHESSCSATYAQAMEPFMSSFYAPYSYSSGSRSYVHAAASSSNDPPTTGSVQADVRQQSWLAGVPTEAVEMFSGDVIVDDLLLERFFPSSTFDAGVHNLLDLGYAYEFLPEDSHDVPKNNRLLPCAMPEWLYDVLGKEVVSMFTGDGVVVDASGLRQSENAYIADTFVPYLYALSGKGDGELLPLTWEVLARMELAPSFQREDSILAITPNGVTIPVLSAQHLQEIAATSSMVIRRRTPLTGLQLYPGSSQLPFLVRTRVRDDQARETFTTWFQVMLAHLMTHAQADQPPAVPTVATSPVARKKKANGGKKRKRVEEEEEEEPAPSRKRKSRKQDD